jgi:twinkle protein
LAHWRKNADVGIVIYRDCEARKTIVSAKKIRRQPMCGALGQVEFWFMGQERRFEAVAGSYRALGAATCCWAKATSRWV